jgi:ADP-heptose:LPS heptosyltransferase
VNRLLLMHLEDMGDVVVTTPAIRAARRAFPNARIDFLTGKAGVSVLQHNPYLDSIIPWGRSRRHLQLLTSMPLRRYNAVVDFSSRRRSIQLSWASQAPVRVGSNRTAWQHVVYTDVVFDFELARIYVARQKLEYLRPLGFVPSGQPEEWRTELFPSEGDRAWASEVFARFGLNDRRPVVALSGATTKRFKQWGVENWGHVADALSDAGAQVLLTHGPGEYEQVAAIACSTRANVVWDYGSTSVLQLAALMERCTMWVGNDGGAKHIATASGLPTVVVNRHRISPIWSDLREGSWQVAIERTPALGCVPNCGRCLHQSCLREVTRSDVVHEALAMLASRTGLAQLVSSAG